MVPISFWQYFDFISLFVLTVTVTFLIILQVYRTKQTPITISQSVATSPRSSIIFSVIMTIFFPLYYCFLWFWVGPYISAPTAFYALLVLAFIAELIFVWAPAKDRTKHIHSISAGFVGVLMILLSIVIFLAGANLSDVPRVTILIFWMTALVAGFTLIKKSKEYYFGAELLFCVTFLVMISVIAHT